MSNNTSTTEVLEVKIKGNSSSLIDETDRAERKLKDFENTSASIGETVKKIFAAVSIAKITQEVGSLVSQGMQLASSLTEVENVVEQSFGDMSYMVESFVQTSVQQFGLSELSAKQTSSTYMAMASGLGMAKQESANMSIELTKLSADMASFYNVEQSIAANALRSIFTGETEALKQYGVVMTQANLQQFALSQGIQKNVSDLTQAEQVSLRYNFVLQSLNMVQGDFARTSDSFSNQTRVLKENWNSLLGVLGEKAIEALTPTLQKLTDLTTWAVENSNVISAGIDTITNSAISLGVGFAALKLGPVFLSISSSVLNTVQDFITLKNLGFSTAEILSSSFNTVGTKVNAVLTSTRGQAISTAAAIGGITFAVTALVSTWDDTSGGDKIRAVLLGIAAAATTAAIAMIAFNASIGNIAGVALGVGGVATGAYLYSQQSSNITASNEYASSALEDLEYVNFRGAVRSKTELENLGIDWTNGSSPIIQGYATGSVITKPTLGLIGEYAESYSNPEIVSPKSTIYNTVKEALTDLGIRSDKRNDSSEEIIITNVTQLDGKTVYKNQNKVKRERGYEFSGMGAFAR